MISGIPVWMPEDNMYHCTVKSRTLTNSGHLRALKNLWCPLFGDSLTEIVTFETKHFIRYSMHVRY